MNNVNRIFPIKISILILLFILSGITSSFAQTVVSISGSVKDRKTKAVLPFVTVTLKNSKDSTLVQGTITNEEGRFTLSNIKSGNYYTEVTFIGYKPFKQNVYVGTLSQYLGLGTIELEEDAKVLNEVEVTAMQEEVSGNMDKKSFTLENNATQSGEIGRAHV